MAQLNFVGQIENAANFEVPAGTLREGANTVTLTAQDGENDISVVDYIQLTYPRTYTAQNGAGIQRPSWRSCSSERLPSVPTRLVDITNAAQPLELGPQISQKKGLYSLRREFRGQYLGKHTLVSCF